MKRFTLLAAVSDAAEATTEAASNAADATVEAASDAVDATKEMASDAAEAYLLEKPASSGFFIFYKSRQPSPST